MEFPGTFIPDRSTRIGRMLIAGDIRVTLNNKVTIRFKAMLDNRDRSKKALLDRLRISETDRNRNWVRVPFDHATHLFIEVPNSRGEYPDKVGIYYPKTNKFFPEHKVDSEFINAAVTAAHYLVSNGNIEGYQIEIENNCGRCGQQLTGKEAIERGICDKCTAEQTPTLKAPRFILNETHTPRVREILTHIMSLTDDEVSTIYNELKMWQL